jgi:hypothetical protein
MDHHQPITLADLYPHLSDEQLGEAEANLEQFLAVMMRISDRLKTEAASGVVGADLTDSKRGASIPAAKVESTPQ